MPGQYCDFPGIRPAPAQSAPGSMGSALHEFKTRRTGGDDARIEIAHLGGTIESGRQIVVRMRVHLAGKFGD
ncbi:hypothetical protein D3C80_1332000 [compost metagenome]